MSDICTTCIERRFDRNVAVWNSEDFNEFRGDYEDFDDFVRQGEIRSHVQKHSDMLDTCVDANIINLVEFFNILGLKTFASCEAPYNSYTGQEDQAAQIVLWLPLREIIPVLEDAKPEWIPGITYKSSFVPAHDGIGRINEAHFLTGVYINNEYIKEF